MNPITLCMIVKNESQCLERAISSVRDYVSEIVICDNYSNDDTIQIAEIFNPKIIIQRQLEGDYAQLRNYLWEYVSYDWTLWVDADEIFDRTVCEWFPYLLEYAKQHEIDHYSFIRRTYINEQLQNPMNIDIQRRLCKKNCRWVGSLHEYIVGKNGMQTALVFDHVKTLSMQENDNKNYGKWQKVD